jgi:ABC-2 type transport system ATP-binding protein
MLEARGLTRRFGSILAVDGLDLTVEPGQIYGLLGPNGAGKTTSIKIMTGLLRPTSGTVHVGGFDLQADPVACKKLIGYVADEPFLYEKLSPVEFLRFTGELYGVDRATLDGRIERLLRLFDLEERSHTLIEGFSHGMKQKTALAGALVHDPRILFLDEPTVGLDPRGARMLKEILKRLSARGVSIVLSTHILEIAEKLCDHVAIVFKGQVVTSGSVGDLKSTNGEGSLEDVFLEITGGHDTRDFDTVLGDP